MRINKYLSECGLCSRREGDILTEEKRITVNGETAVVGMSVFDDDEVRLDGRRVKPLPEKTYLAFNKPVGIVCTGQKRESNNLIDYLNLSKRVTYAGRLDKNSEGLLILTDDGDFIDLLMTGGNSHEKEYVVRVSGPLDDEKIKKLEAGVYLKEIDRVTKPCKAWQSGKDEFHIVLTQGINRQIRRMCRNLKMSVLSIKRIRIENICLGSLNSGEYRNLSEEELREIKERLAKTQKSNRR